HTVASIQFNFSIFPVDDETLRYLTVTGRDPALVELVEGYCKELGFFRTDMMEDPAYSDTLELDMNTVETCLAGPKRPQDRVNLKDAGAAWRTMMTAPVGPRGFGLKKSQVEGKIRVGNEHKGIDLKHGDVVIAAVTSCTNTSNPSVMIAAGLLARNAVERGLMVKPWVKTSLAPGSKVVTEYLEAAGLLKYFEALRFHLVGYGCTTCIGNSGPLLGPVVKAIREGDLLSVAVLSGNRNFEGRINPDVRASFLASPPLVVACALTGTIDFDWDRDPLGLDPMSGPVYLRDIWPGQEEIREVLSQSLNRSMFKSQYSNVFTGNEQWNAVPVSGGKLYTWNPQSTYIQEPPFFKELNLEVQPVKAISGARILLVLPDSTTTDHISPAGAIAPDSPAAQYLKTHNVSQEDWNTFGSRRGNHEVMMRGTFANIRIKNRMLKGIEGGYTVHVPSGERLSVWDAAERYLIERTPLIVLAGKEYGSGSSRDWAAKGSHLLGVKAVIAQSFERIHRSNLVGMGVLPLQFKDAENVESLGLTGLESYDIMGLSDKLKPRETYTVRATAEDGKTIEFAVASRIDTEVEVLYYKNGGILHTVLRGFLDS
ncbi:aconitate hydratase, partial [Acidobacteriota bacterium]